MINELQFKFQEGQETFLLSRVFRPAHTAFYSVGTRGIFSGGWNSWTVKLTTDLQLILWLRMSGAIAAQGQLYFTFYKKMQFPKHNNLHQPWKQTHCFLSCHNVFIYKKFQNPTLS